MQAAEASIAVLSEKYRHFIRFIVVGVINTLVDILTFYILYRFLSVHYSISQIVAYIAGCVNSFIMNKVWTFEDKQVNKKTSLQLIRFVIVNLLSLGVSELGLKALIDYAAVNAYISKIIIIIPTWSINFFGYKLWVFGAKPVQK